MRSPTTLLLFVVSAFGPAATACGCGGHADYPPGTQHPLLGHALPDIRRATLDGHPLDAAQLAGKPVLVKFFADYCAPCKKTLPAVQALHQQHPEVTFIGIDEDDSTETARALAQRYALTFPVIRDEDNVLSGRFRVDSMPTTFVADSGGVVRWVGGDGQTEEDLRRAVEAAR